MSKLLRFLNLIFIFSIYAYANEEGRINFPFKSTILISGYTYEILWEGNGNWSSKIKIELFQNSSLLLTISPDTENDGKFSWNVPELHTNMLNIYNYFIRITDLINSNNFIDSDLFIIFRYSDLEPFVIIPAAVHTSGAYNSKWETDLYFYNSFDVEDSINIFMFFFKEGKLENEAPIGYYFKIQKEEIKILKDVVQSAFRTSGAGSIIIVNDYRHEVYYAIPVTAILYNNMGENGIYGTYIPGVSHFIGKYTNILLLNLKQNENFRTNIAIASRARFPIKVKIYLYNDKATLIGEKEITVPPFGFHQEYMIYSQFASERIDGGFASIEVLDPDLKTYIFPFASVIDNRFGDIYFVPALLR